MACCGDSVHTVPRSPSRSQKTTQTTGTSEHSTPYRSLPVPRQHVRGWAHFHRSAYSKVQQARALTPHRAMCDVPRGRPTRQCLKVTQMFDQSQSHSRDDPTIHTTGRYTNTRVRGSWGPRWACCRSALRWLRIGLHSRIWRFIVRPRAVHLSHTQLGGVCKL